MENIILIGHGSPKKEANNLEAVGNMLHGRLHPGCRNDCVKIAYLQFSDPGIMETIHNSVRSGSKKIIIHPFFLSAGMHVTKDIPDIIRDAERLYPDVKFVYTEPLGIHEKLADIIAERIKGAGIFLPDDIEKRSLEIISEELDLKDIPAEQMPVVKRVIHATADFEYRNTLVFHRDAIEKGLAAIRAGKDILTDVEMVRAGINIKRLKQRGGKVICNIRQSVGAGLPRPTDLQTQPPVSPFVKGELKGVVESGLTPAAKSRETRAEIGIERALKENNNIGIIAIGNAPTALLKVIEMFTPPTPPLIKGGNTGGVPLVVGVPVGFVKAFESKGMLAAQDFPFITNLSRKGGSPVAAAIINALLKIAEEKK